MYKVHQSCAGKRADNRRNQYDGGDNRHQPDPFCLAERLLHRDITNGGNKTDTGALNCTRDKKLCHRRCEHCRSAGKGKY
ncbi:hypothetical protein ExPCM15_01673 [Escherichia coli]|nr:hypothetical protein ExPCM15_01673 [Escherichia coli]